MISAPSEMRCMSMPDSSMIGKTMASVSGMESATTRPGRTPRLMKLTARMIAIACQQRCHEFGDGVVDGDGLVGDQLRLDADRQVGRDLAPSLLDVLAERQDVAAVAHGDRKADRRLAVDAEQRLRRVGDNRGGPGDIAQPEHAAADDEVDVRDVLLGYEGT